MISSGVSPPAPPRLAVSAEAAFSGEYPEAQAGLSDSQIERKFCS